MQLEIKINGSSDSKSHFITWAPANCQIRLTDAGGAANPVRLKLKNREPVTAGKVNFRTDNGGVIQPPTPELQLDLPVDGTPIDFFVAGDYPHASINGQDAAIEVVDSNNTVLFTVPLMVRIRKNAEKLTMEERILYLDTLSKLKTSGMFDLFRNIHKGVNDIWTEIHTNISFLVWHRAFILHYERELQNINPNVSLPYWRFDELTENVFTKDFMGKTTAGNLMPEFSQTNPLFFWKVEGDEILRQREARNINNQDDTFNLGNVEGIINFRNFSSMEWNPHNPAHTSMGGWLTSSKSSWDPLFYMLHCNVDRLWARWQKLFQKFDVNNTGAYPNLGMAGDPGADRIGRNLKDTLWPWNGDMTAPRPNTAPGSGDGFPLTATAPAPSTNTPTLEEMIDYDGKFNLTSRLGYDYDDINDPR